MPRTPKSWQQKLADAKAKPGLPKVFFCDKTQQNLLVPSPAEIEDMILAIPKGRLVTIAQLADRLREAHKADAACSMTTGIFAWLIAHAAEEAVAKGAKRITPWWRVLKTGGVLNPRYPGAGRTQQEHLEAEGHQIVRRRKTLQVVDFERAMD